MGTLRIFLSVFLTSLLAYPAVYAAEPPSPAGEEFVFIGTVTELAASALPKSSTQNWLVSTKVEATDSAEFIGKTVQFRIHSPIKSGIVVGHRYRFYTTRIDNFFTVDELKIEPQN